MGRELNNISTDTLDNWLRGRSSQSLLIASHCRMSGRLQPSAQLPGSECSKHSNRQLVRWKGRAVRASKALVMVSATDTLFQLLRVLLNPSLFETPFVDITHWKSKWLYRQDCASMIVWTHCISENVCFSTFCIVSGTEQKNLPVIASFFRPLHGVQPLQAAVSGLWWEAWSM